MITTKLQYNTTNHLLANTIIISVYHDVESWTCTLRESNFLPNKEIPQTSPARPVNPTKNLAFTIRVRGALFED